MTKFLKSTSYAFAVLILLNSCGAFKPKYVDSRKTPANAAERAKQNVETGKGISLNKALKGIDLQQLDEVVIAYEPVWAIGTGLTPSYEEIESTHKFIRENNKKFNNFKILYGGSVNPKNISQLKLIDNIDGYLIGGASQNPNKFIDIIKKSYN